jgi:hypothetical protein
LKKFLVKKCTVLFVGLKEVDGYRRYMKAPITIKNTPNMNRDMNAKDLATTFLDLMNMMPTSQMKQSPNHPIVNLR